MIDLDKKSGIERKEQEERVEVLPQISSQLFEGVRTPVLGIEVIDNPEFKKQVGERQNVHRKLEQMYSQIPDVTMGFDEAIKNNLVTEGELENFYSTLSVFINSDPNHARLLLYLPLESLPDMSVTSYRPDLDAARKIFSQTCNSALDILLNESDVRASFVDGDILEPGMGEPKRVRKAAHLIPFLLEKGIVSIEEIEQKLNAARNSNELELVASLKDGLEFYTEIKQGLSPEEISLDLGKILSDYKTKRRKIDEDLSPQTEYAKSVSTKRIIWERQVKVEELIQETARIVAKNIATGAITQENLEQLESADEDEKSIYFSALIKYLELNKDEKTDLADIYANKALSLAISWWKESSSTLKDRLFCGLSHAQKMGYIGNDFFTRHGLETPDLYSINPVDADHLIKKDYSLLLSVAEAIESDKEMSEYLCPFFIAIGSRIKGINALGSDKDCVLFWKPDTTIENRQKTLKKLVERFPGLRDYDSMPEVWLEEQDGKFKIKKNNDSPNSVTPQQIHFILGGVWFGGGEFMNRVATDLTESYLDLNRMGQEKDLARYHLLRRLELDTLMYRLMHKGFKRQYPSKKRDLRIDGKSIDWSSDYYEPEYRRIASLLYTAKVFLPDLDLSKKRRQH